MTPTKTRSTQIDEEQTLETSENRLAKGTQTISHNLGHFACNPKDAYTAWEIIRLAQSQDFTDQTRSLFVGELIFLFEKATQNFGYDSETHDSEPLIKQSKDFISKFFHTELDGKTNTYSEQPSKALLNKLLDMGFAWTHVASMIHVPVHIVRDLDCDEGNSENLSEAPHKNLAQLLALIEMLEEKLPNRNIASWLETALDGYYYSGIDVISRNQIDLLVKYADGEISNTELLDKCFPNWKDNHDERIEIFTASDGENSIRLRNDNLED